MPVPERLSLFLRCPLFSFARSRHDETSTLPPLARGPDPARPYGGRGAVRRGNRSDHPDGQPTGHGLLQRRSGQPGIGGRYRRRVRPHRRVHRSEPDGVDLRQELLAHGSGAHWKPHRHAPGTCRGQPLPAGDRRHPRVLQRQRDRVHPRHQRVDPVDELRLPQRRWQPGRQNLHGRGHHRGGRRRRR